MTINTRLMKAKRKVVENEVVFGKHITFDLPHSTQEKIATLVCWHPLRTVHCILPQSTFLPSPLTAPSPGCSVRFRYGYYI